jgi:hypothetical protein
MTRRNTGNTLAKRSAQFIGRYLAIVSVTNLPLILKTWLTKYESRDLFIMGAVARQVAFEQDEAVGWEGIGREVGVAPFESRRDRSAAALVACQRYVRMKGAPLWFKAGLDARPIDLGGKLGNRLSRLDACP